MGSNVTVFMFKKNKIHINPRTRGLNVILAGKTIESMQNHVRALEGCGLVVL